MKIENENSLVLLIWNMGSSEKKNFKNKKMLSFKRFGFN